ncbi:MAG TPA: hypothetical protein VJ385_05475 [Fibrobacteria bacterium]|nr:hypothetical protein [Fibrobacteria bacterium]
MGLRAAASFFLIVSIMMGGAHETARKSAWPPFPADTASFRPAAPERSLRVTASAYNSLRGQTDSRPDEAAWGDTLTPGLRAIAVSRDLIPLGLGQGAMVRIEGLPGEYRVLDKMHARWRKRIDVYFGVDLKGAREWGEQKVVIRWRDPGAEDSSAVRTSALPTPRTRS